jgi:hypothetical protein
MGDGYRRRWADGGGIYPQRGADERSWRWGRTLNVGGALRAAMSEG